MILLSQAGRKSSVTDTRAWSKRALPSVFWAPPTKHTQVLKWINAEPQLYMWIKLCPFQVMSLCLIHARFSKAPKHSPNKSRSLKILNHDSKSEIHTKLGLLCCTTTMYFIINSQLQKNISLDIRAWLSVLMCIRFLLTLLSFLFTLIYPSPLSSSLLLMPHADKTNTSRRVCVCVLRKHLSSWENVPKVLAKWMWADEVKVI